MKLRLLLCLLVLLGPSLEAGARTLDLLDSTREGLPRIVWRTWLASPGQLTAHEDFFVVGASNLDPRSRHQKSGEEVIGLDGRFEKGASVEARTGKLVCRSFHQGLKDRDQGIPWHPITSQPAVDGDRVYFLSTNGEFTCVDLKGLLLSVPRSGRPTNTSHGLCLPLEDGLVMLQLK